MNTIYSSSRVIWNKLSGFKSTTNYRTHQVIFTQGEKPKGLFFIEKGLVKLDYTSTQGHVHTLRIFKDDEVFGYRSFFANDEYHASAIAVEPTTVSFITHADILSFFKTYPEAALEILQIMSRDLRQAEEKWTDQMDKETGERVAEALLYFDSHFDRKHWTRREIAEWAGTTPETVIRTLAVFEKNGLIDQSNGRSIVILEKHKLIQKAAELIKK